MIFFLNCNCGCGIKKSVKPRVSVNSCRYLYRIVIFAWLSLQTHTVNANVPPLSRKVYCDWCMNKVCKLYISVYYYVSTEILSGKRSDYEYGAHIKFAVRIFQSRGVILHPSLVSCQPGAAMRAGRHISRSCYLLSSVQWQWIYKCVVVNRPK